MTLIGLLVFILFVILIAFLFKETLRMTSRQILLVVACLSVAILIVLMMQDNPMVIR